MKTIKTTFLVLLSIALLSTPSYARQKASHQSAGIQEVNAATLDEDDSAKPKKKKTTKKAKKSKRAKSASGGN